MAPNPNDIGDIAVLHSSSEMYLNQSKPDMTSPPSCFCDEKHPEKCHFERYVGTIDNMTSDNVGRRGHQCTPTFWQVGAVIGCFLVNFFSGGILSCYGVLYTYMQEPLAVSEYQLTWIGSLSAGFHGFTSILTTVLIDSKGCRTTTLVGPILVATGLIIGSQSSNIYVLYVTLGVLPGVGLCLSYNATVVYVNGLFTKWRPLAVGISVAGSAGGMLIFSPLTSGLADIMGWRGAVLLHGALVLHLVPCALWIKPTSKSDSSSQDNTSIVQCIINYIKVFRIRGTIFFSFAYFFIGLGSYAFSTFIPRFVMSSYLNMTTTDAALIISLAGLGSFLGRIFFAGASLVHSKAPQAIFTIALVFCGLTHITVPLNRDRIEFLANGVFFGLTQGAWPTVASVVFVNVFGLDNLSKIFGTVTFCQGVGSFSGPPLQSYIAALLDSQEVVFYSAGVCFIISALCVLPVLLGRNVMPGNKMNVEINVVGTGNEGFTADTVLT